MIYLKSHNKFYEDISIARGFSSEDMFKFSDIVKMQVETDKVTAESICNAKENINESETEYALVEDLLNIHRTASNETTLFFNIPNTANNENIIIAPGQGKTPVFVLTDEFCKEQAFPYPLPTSKIDCNAPRDIPSPAQYLNQRWLKFNQWFTSDAD